MDNEKKTITVTLELEPLIAGFHKRFAEEDGVSLEVHLLNIIKKQTESEQESRRQMVTASAEETRKLFKGLGYSNNLPIGALESEPYDETDEE